MRTQHKTAVRPEPFVWTPSALSARLEAERALDDMPRRHWGISAEASSNLARIVAQVEQRILPQEAATEELRELAGRLVTHQRVQQVIRRGSEPTPGD